MAEFCEVGDEPSGSIKEEFLDWVSDLTMHSGVILPPFILNTK